MAYVLFYCSKIQRVWILLGLQVTFSTLNPLIETFILWLKAFIGSVCGKLASIQVLYIAYHI